MAAVAAAASLIAAQASNQGGEPIDPSTYSSALAAAVSAAQAEYTKRTQSKQQQKTSAQESTLDTSRIRHMLLVDDPQLAKINTPYGWVRFLQVRGANAVGADSLFYMFPIVERRCLYLRGRIMMMANDKT